MLIHVVHQDSGNGLKQQQMFDECMNLSWLMYSLIAGKIKNDLEKGEVLRKMAEFKIFITTKVIYEDGYTNCQGSMTQQ